MDSRAKLFSYRGGMYLLLTLLIVTLIGGFIVYRYSLLHHLVAADYYNEIIFYSIIGVASIASIIALMLAIHLNRNIASLQRAAEAMENGANIDSAPEFAHDELGDISRHIIDLYSRLHQASNDVKREHDLATHEHQEKLRIIK